MSKMRLPLLIVVALLALGCEHETFDLLPPPADEPSGGMAGAGRSGFGAGGFGAFGGTFGGRGGRDNGGPVPEPDCPESQPCRACRTWMDCSPGELCDTLRHYCAPYCTDTRECYDPVVSVCDESRNVCVECTIDTHCGPQRCIYGKCVPQPPAECSNVSPCRDPSEPVCDRGECRPCFNDFECPGKRCAMTGRCEPIDGGGQPMP